MQGRYPGDSSMPWDDAKSVFRGFNFPDWVNQVEMGHFGGSDRKTNCTSGHFFWPRNAYPVSKMSKMSKMFLFLLFRPKFDKADSGSFKGQTKK